MALLAGEAGVLAFEPVATFLVPELLPAFRPSNNPIFTPEMLGVTGCAVASFLGRIRYAGMIAAFGSHPLLDFLVATHAWEAAGAKAE
jgi:hypothetical protein